VIVSLNFDGLISRSRIPDE